MKVLLYVLNTTVPRTRPHGPGGCISFMHGPQGSRDPLTSLIAFANAIHSRHTDIHAIVPQNAKEADASGPLHLLLPLPGSLFS